MFACKVLKGVGRFLFGLPNIFIRPDSTGAISGLTVCRRNVLVDSVEATVLCGKSCSRLLRQKFFRAAGREDLSLSVL
jgi:hypothetical protein